MKTAMRINVALEERSGLRSVNILSCAEATQAHRHHKSNSCHWPGRSQAKLKQNPMPMAYHVSSSVMSVSSADSNVRTGIWDLFSASKRNVTYKTYKDGSCARVQTTSLS